MTNVVVIAPGPQIYVDHLAAAFPDLTVASADLPGEAIEAALADAEVLVTAGMGPGGAYVTPELTARMPRLRWVQGIAAGYDHLVAGLVDRPEVVLTSGVGIHGPQISEIVALHMIGLKRHVKRIVRNQDAHRWELIVGEILDGLTMGVVGLGPVGARVARVGKAFGMHTRGLARSTRYASEVDHFHPPSELHEMAAEVDFLVLTLPLTPETDKLVDRSVLAAMKPTACLVNVARGGVVDEEALIEALRDGTIAGAGLDVFTQEPLPADSPLWDMDNVVITTHFAGFHTRYAEQVLTIIEPNVRHYLAGELDRLVNVVAR
ncbi:MAG: D-2-hydroxyacid dehydrogenase [Acidimicrobiia bacterium]